MFEPSIQQGSKRLALRALGPVTQVRSDREAERIEAFGRAIEALRREIEPQIGEADAAHIRRVGSLSSRLELLGRALIHFSFDPLTFGLGTAALYVHKSLELMEIGHLALHGAYDGLSDAERYQSKQFDWKAPIDEASWKVGHNIRHHQYTNIAGMDPDLDFGALRLSARIPFRSGHALQPLSNVATWFSFANAINLHVTGLLHVYVKQGEIADDREAPSLGSAHRTFLSKWIRYHGREFVFFPLLAGPFFPKVLLGNLLSEVARDLTAGAIIYCGHVDATDYPAGTEPASRAHWYAMQVEAARDVDLPESLSILCGALDRQIEHHLFPRMPPNRLREIAPRVRAICEAHGVHYRSSGPVDTMRSVLAQLRRLGSRRTVAAATAMAE